MLLGSYRSESVTSLFTLRENSVKTTKRTSYLGSIQKEIYNFSDVPIKKSITTFRKRISVFKSLKTAKQKEE